MPTHLLSHAHCMAGLGLHSNRKQETCLALSFPPDLCPYHQSYSTQHTVHPVSQAGVGAHFGGNTARPSSTNGCDAGSLRHGLVCTTPFLTWWVDQGDVVPVLQVSPLHQHHGYLLSPLVQLDTRQRVCYCALSITRTNGYDVFLISQL